MEPQTEQVQLWVGSCWRCAGRGVVALGELVDAGLAGDDGGAVCCPVCMGSGVDTEHTTARRLRDDTQ